MSGPDLALDLSDPQNRRQGENTHEMLLTKKKQEENSYKALITTTKTEDKGRTLMKP